MIKKIVHRDIARRNVLLSHQLRAVVCDFGLSRTIHRSVTALQHGYYYHKDHDYAEPFWQKAPEMLKNNVSTTASDVWMFGEWLLHVLCMDTFYAG